MCNQTMQFGLVFSPDKCNGCGDCERVCIAAKKSSVAIGRPRIAISKDGDKYKATVCVHCEVCPPNEVCPSALLEFHDEGKYWTLDEHRCFACMACIPRCPYDAVFFEGKLGIETAYMCDLCGGDPKCIKACPENALALSDARGNEG
ncbi:MAG: 4Fe-4S dicluster domain-containing protein [Thermoplasmata archaeon]|nr:4Fe-4S dicluster domain-containing protein [Thermoplasmata archaeon]